MKDIHLLTQFLTWWKMNVPLYPFLSILSRKFLCISATFVPSERIFSAASHIASKLRASLSPENVDALLFLRQNAELIKPGESNKMPLYSPARTSWRSGKVFRIWRCMNCWWLTTYLLTCVFQHYNFWIRK